MRANDVPAFDKHGATPQTARDNPYVVLLLTSPRIFDRQSPNARSWIQLQSLDTRIQLEASEQVLQRKWSLIQRILCTTCMRRCSNGRPIREARSAPRSNTTATIETWILSSRKDGNHSSLLRNEDDCLPIRIRQVRKASISASG